MGCIYSTPLTKSESYSKEGNQRIKWSSNLPEELNYKGGEKSSASSASRMITPEGPEKNSAIVPEEFVTRSSCVNDVEVINAWELWDGLEEEAKDDEDEKVDYKFVVISKNLEEDESLTRNKSTVASMEESEKEEELKDEAGAEQGATLKEVGVVKEESDKEDELKDEASVEKAEFAKNTSLKDWLRQGSKAKHPRFSIGSKLGSFAFPELEFSDERDEESVFDPQMLAQFEQAMDQLNTDEEFLLEEIIMRLGQDQEKEVIESTE